MDDKVISLGIQLDVDNALTTFRLHPPLSPMPCSLPRRPSFHCPSVILPQFVPCELLLLPFQYVIYKGQDSHVTRNMTYYMLGVPYVMYKCGVCAV